MANRGLRESGLCLPSFLNTASSASQHMEHGSRSSFHHPSNHSAHSNALHDRSHMRTGVVPVDGLIPRSRKCTSSALHLDSGSSPVVRAPVMLKSPDDDKFSCQPSNKAHLTNPSPSSPLPSPEPAPPGYYGADYFARSYRPINAWEQGEVRVSRWELAQRERSAQQSRATPKRHQRTWAPRCEYKGGSPRRAHAQVQDSDDANTMLRRNTALGEGMLSPFS